MAPKRIPEKPKPLRAGDNWPKAQNAGQSLPQLADFAPALGPSSAGLAPAYVSQGTQTPSRAARVRTTTVSQGTQTAMHGAWVDSHAFLRAPLPSVRAARTTPAVLQVHEPAAAPNMVQKRVAAPRNRANGKRKGWQTDEIGWLRYKVKKLHRDANVGPDKTVRVKWKELASQLNAEFQERGLARSGNAVFSAAARDDDLWSLVTSRPRSRAYGYPNSKGKNLEERSGEEMDEEKEGKGEEGPDEEGTEKADEDRAE